VPSTSDVDELEIASPAPTTSCSRSTTPSTASPRWNRSKAELVKLRYFVGLKIEEAAEVLGISEATAKRLVAVALARALQRDPDA
jgi:DNA-directed RNA polymerase specialized sigma24 family protein